MGKVQSPSPTALVVEDEPLQSELACTLLEEAEFAVVECQSAEAALAVFAKKIGRRCFRVHRCQACRDD
jgi:CheY-like chemotaxis protein